MHSIASLCRFHYHSVMWYSRDPAKKNKLHPQIRRSQGQEGGREAGEGETHPFIFHVSIYSGSWRRVKQDGREEGNRR